jgi:hypothetical protein
VARVSVSSMFLWDLDPEGIVDVVARAGLEEIEFWVETPWYWEGDGEKIRLERSKESSAN